MLARSLALLAAVVLLQGVPSQVKAVDASQSHAKLAVEAPGGEQGNGLPGPEPNLKTSFAPEEYEAPWTWWLSVILTAVTVVIIVAFGLAYYLLIHRPRQRIPQP